jgi:hypothetical protein
MEIRKIEPERCKDKGKEEEKTNQIVASELGPQLNSLPRRLRIQKLVILCCETLLTECFQSRKFTVAVGAARHDSGKALSEPYYSACLRNWE